MTKRRAWTGKDHVRIYDGTTRHGREPYTMECMRCLAIAAAGPLPLPVDELVRQMNAFRDLHLLCQEVPPCAPS